MMLLVFLDDIGGCHHQWMLFLPPLLTTTASKILKRGFILGTVPQMQSPGKVVFCSTEKNVFSDAVTVNKMIASSSHQ